MNTGLMFSSATAEWETPQEFYDALNEVFRFNLDVCATKENAKTPSYFDRETDGLASDWAWAGTCYMNPPYGREIGKWVQKAYESGKAGATVVCLLPARTDTRWWQDYCTRGEIHFVRGRLKFGGSANSAPFPSAVVVFRPRLEDVAWN